MRRVLFFLCFFLLQTFFLQAQPGAGDPTNGNPTPISGVEILLVAGGVLGIKKLVSRKEKG